MKTQTKVTYEDLLEALRTSTRALRCEALSGHEFGCLKCSNEKLIITAVHGKGSGLRVAIKAIEDGFHLNAAQNGEKQ